MVISPYSSAGFVYAEVERVTRQKNIENIRVQGQEILVTVRPTGMDLNDHTLAEGSASLPQYGDGPQISAQAALAMIGPLIAAQGAGFAITQIVDGFLVQADSIQT